LKRRDYELTLNERFDAANEEIKTLAVMPPAALSEDRVRALRTGADGTWRLREYGTTIIYGANYSRGLERARRAHHQRRHAAIAVVAPGRGRGIQQA
jgi:hypothetical protein